MEKLKFNTLFVKILEPSYVLDSYYSDNLINKLNSCDFGKKYVGLCQSLTNHISEAIKNIKNLHSSVQVFIIRLLAVVSKTESCFSKIIYERGDIICEKLNQISSTNCSPSLRVAYMELVTAVVKHDSGIRWLLKNEIWKEVFSLCNNNQTVFVIRQTYKFSSNFLWKLNDAEDSNSIRQVLEFILNPLEKSEFLNAEAVTSENEIQYSKILEPMLQILLSVVSEENRIQQSNIIIKILVDDFDVVNKLLIAFERIRLPNTSIAVTKLIFWILLAKIFASKPLQDGVFYEFEEFLGGALTYFGILAQFTARRNPILVLDFCNACYIIWNTVWKKQRPPMTDVEEQRLKFPNQLMFLSLIPCLVYATKEKTKPSLSNETVRDFIYRFIDTRCEFTITAAYAIRDLTLQLDTLLITVQSVKRLYCMKNHLNNEQANIVFQVLFYVLRLFDPTDDRGDVAVDENYDETEEKLLVMTYVMDTVLILVKNHDINWKESLEVISLYNVVSNILKRPNLSCKFVMTCLNIISITIQKFLTPNLALLIESQPGSKMDEIGKLIFNKIHDKDWEVRDSALELLNVCIDISYIKYQSIQKQIMDNDLVNVAAAVAMNDFEAYVQATALKCIAAACKVCPLWTTLVERHPDILDKLLSILCENQEGVVRKEACIALSEVYQTIKLDSEEKNNIHEHILSAAIMDFHWEVQQKALAFWKMIFNSLLTSQGMLDGSFPPVTFSKQSNKIVSLTPEEIGRRVVLVIEQFSIIGGLTVLVKLLQDDNDVDIMIAALDISQDVLTLVEKYGIEGRLASNNETIDDVLLHIKSVSTATEERGEACETIDNKAENVIKDILNSKDVNLLSNIYERTMKLGGETEIPAKPKIKLKKTVSPKVFVEYIKNKDFHSVIEQKRLWKDGIKSLSSLLDDVLGIYHVEDEVNSMDCY